MTRQMATLADDGSAARIWVILDLCYEQLIYEPMPTTCRRSWRRGCAIAPSCAARRRSRMR